MLCFFVTLVLRFYLSPYYRLILSLTLLRNSCGNSYIQFQVIIIYFCFSCSESVTVVDLEKSQNIFSLVIIDFGLAILKK